VNKVFTVNADCVVLDCEDGVAINRKKEARENIRNLYNTDARVQNDSNGKYSVRINSPCSDLACLDLESLFGGTKHVPHTIVMPKTSNLDEVKWLYETIHKNLGGNVKRSLNLIFIMESALGLINLGEIIKNSFDLSARKYENMFNLEGFIFGSDDFCADIGISRTKDSTELTYARQKLVTYCKAYKLKAIDMVHIDFKG
jgi:citrate lyase subunit beta-like protein